MSGCVKRDKEKSQPIQVFIRPRPLNRQESDLRTGACIEVVGSKDITVKQQYGKRYTFDKVFNLSSHQIDIYKTVVKPLIPEVIAGYNCTVFAYGQTGTGKTYTMAGGSPSTVSSWHNDPEAGIIPRAMAHLFDELCVIPQQYTVRVSYIELYNEELFDLLSDNVDNKNIRLFEDHQQKGSVIINGASTETVYNKNEVYNILLKGQEKRRTASTLLNAQSSRSHTVFIIMVHTCETTLEGEQLVKTGKLNLVDLAGSENINRSGAVDRRAREAGNINQSLLTLGRVIKALVEKTAHIPYRYLSNVLAKNEECKKCHSEKTKIAHIYVSHKESKLTRILQDSLGGRTKTSIIATISPSLSCLEETLSTLDYAHRAKYITNRPEINQRVSEKAWKAQYEKEMDQLRKDLHAARTGSGVYLDTENYHRLITDSENFKEELSEKSSHNIQLELQIQNLEQQKEIKESEWNAIRISFDATKNELRHCKDMLEKNSHERKEQEFLADYYKLKVDSLYTQAKYLLDETDATTKRHQETLKRLYSTSQENNLLATEIIDKVAKKSSEIIDDLMKFILKIRDIYECLDDIVTHSQNTQEKEYERIKVTKEQMLLKIGVFVNTIECNLEEALSEDYKKQKSFLHRIEGKLETVKNLCKGLDIKLDLKIIQSKVLTEINSVKDNCKEQDEINECIMSSIMRMESDINTMKNLIKRSQYLSGSSKDSLIKMEKVSTTISDKANVIGKEANNTVQELSEIMKIIEESGHQDMKTNTILSEINKCKLGLETINNSTNMKSKEQIKDIIERAGEDINCNENESNLNIISKTSAICKKANCTVQVLSETMEMIEESSNQDMSTNSVLSGTNICKPNSESRNNSINIELNEQIKDIIETEVQDINCSENQFLTYTAQNNKMKKCFTEVEDTLENVEFLEKIQECRSELENLRSNGLKDIIVSTTPIRPSLRLNLAVPSPKERILSRFQKNLEQTPNKTFGHAEEVNTDCQIFAENGCSEHTNGSSILNNQRNEFRHKNKMSELDKENNET